MSHNCGKPCFKTLQMSQVILMLNVLSLVTEEQLSGFNGSGVLLVISLQGKKKGEFFFLIITPRSQNVAANFMCFLFYFFLSFFSWSCLDFVFCVYMDVVYLLSFVFFLFSSTMPVGTDCCLA